MSDHSGGAAPTSPWDRLEDSALEFAEQGLWEQHRFEIERKRHAETKATWLLTGAAIAVTLLTSSVGLVLTWVKGLGGRVFLTSSCVVFTAFLLFAVLVVCAFVALLSACLRSIQVQTTSGVSQPDAREIKNVTPGTARAVRLELLGDLSKCVTMNNASVSEKIESLSLAQRSLKVALFLIAALGFVLVLAAGWLISRIGGTI